MITKDAPAFDFYPERWLVGVAGMSDAEQLAYLRLLCHQWLLGDCGLPADISALKRLAGARGVTDAVLAKIPSWEDGKRRNKRLETVRSEQRVRIAKSRDKIEKMNAARASTRDTKASLQEPLVEDAKSLLTASSPLTTHHSPPILPNTPNPKPPEPLASPSLELGIIQISEPRLTTDQIEIAALVGRRATTPWSEPEKKAWSKIPKPIDHEDWQALRWYYLESGCQFLRRDLLTLLNKWNGEIDRAKQFDPAAK